MIISRLHRHTWLIATIALALPPHLPAQALEAARQGFKTAPALSSSANGDTAYSGNVLREWTSAQDNLVSLDGYIESNDFNNALSQARQYARTAHTDEVRKLWENLIAAIQTESKARETAFAFKVEELSARGGKIALAATKSADLEGVIDETYALQDARGNNYNSRNQHIYNRVEGLVSFFNAWQDYLGAREAGDFEQARSSLRNLNSNSYRYRPVPRADVIKLIASLKTDAVTATGEALLAGATLDNLDQIRARVTVAQAGASSSNRSNEFYSLLSDLSVLSRAVAELKVDRPVMPRELLRNGNSSTHPYEAEILQLKDTYLVRALPRLSGVAISEQPKAGENALVYIYRLVDEAVKAEDWPRAQRLATVAQDLVPATSSCSLREPLVGANPAVAIKAWTNAQRLEKASQPIAAAEFYRQALNAGAPAKLEEKIIERLADLAAKYPDSIKLVSAAR